MRAAVRDMRGVIEQLLSTSGVRRAGVGALGFGFGAGLAVWAATAWPQIVATVTYYYLAPPGEPDFAQIKGSVLGHFGTADTFISLKDAKALEMDMRSAGVSVEFEKYTGAGHGFFNDTDGLGTYDGLAAERSWRRSVGFLRANLAAPEPPSAA
jgi:carboxymethylenebutenolidase